VLTVFELLATVVHADPAPVAAGLLLLLALGMYPIGILLPSCCACGNAPCENCPAGTLPDTVTVQFPAWDDEMLGAYRHRVSISTITDWAAGAVRPSARVSETVDGVITKIDILDGGSGYALIGRVAPTLTLSGGGGTGATLTPTLTSSGTPAVWTLDSATASGGSGYVDGSSLTITAAAGDTETTKAAATVVARSEPTITATAPGGSGATLSLTLSKSGSPPAWSVAGMTVTAPGTGYTHNGAVQFSTGGATTLSAASATVRTLEVPAHTVDASGAGGTGATFSITYTEETDPEFAGYYYITGLAVTNGGSGYSAGGTVLLKPNTGTRSGVWPDGDAADIVLDYTLSGGAIASVSGYDNAVYYRDRGIIQAVTVTDAGSYYSPTGPAYGVTVAAGGSYYREDKTAAPYVAALSSASTTVEDGGAYSCTPSLTPVVDDDPYSATFGQVTSVTIDDGGCDHNYRVLNLGKRCCKSIFASKAFVLRRNPSDPCKFLYERCEGLGLTRIELVIPATSANYGRQPAYMTTYSGDVASDGETCATTWTATTFIDDCSTLLPTGASSGDTLELEAGERVATVVPGGTYTAAAIVGPCSRCCTSGTLPAEIEVELESNTDPGADGTYVLSLGAAGTYADTPSSAAWTYSSPLELVGGNWGRRVTLRVQYQHCGGWGTPSGTYKPDPDETSDSWSVRGWENAAVNDAYDFAPRQTVKAPWPTGVGGGVPNARAEDPFPGTQLNSQDYISHCGVDCSTKCYIVAQISFWNSSNNSYLTSAFVDSMPAAGALIADAYEAGDTERNKVIAGFEVFYSYFSVIFTGGTTYDIDFPPTIDLPDKWPGRRMTQSVCTACESNLCDPSGRIITIDFPQFNNDTNTLTIL
jgi:hypothetical protein